MRAAPLGWNFGLLFLPLTVTPCIGLVSLAFGITQELWQQLTLAALLSTICALVAALLVRSALRARAKVRAFEEAWQHGRLGQAQVLRLRQLFSRARQRGSRGTRHYRRYRMTLAVYLEGYVPYQVVEDYYFRTEEIAYLSEGRMLPVAVHPTDSGIVVVAPLR